MDPEQSPVSVQNDDNHRSLLPSSSTEESSCSMAAEVSDSDGKESTLVEKVQEIALDSSSSVKTEWTTSRASIHLTTSVHNKTGAMFEEEEEGELDYEEDEGEVPGGQEDKNGLRNDVDDDKEEGEVEDDEQDEEGEEGEILSDDDDDKVNAEKKPQERKDSAKNEADGPEEGEVIDDGDSMGAPVLRTKVCRYFMYGGCTWGNSCRFLHPGHNDKGAYQMLPEPGQYPSPFPKVPAVVPPIHPDAMLTSLPDQDLGQIGDELNDNSVQPIAEVMSPPKKETAWERGLKRAKEIKKAAQKRKEEDADFKEKRMILGITAEDDEDENDKENTMRRREMMRSRLEKEATHCDEEDVRYRRSADIVSRWRDKREASPLQYRDRDRRKKRGFRTPSSSPERDRRSKRRGGEKDKQREKNKETVKERDTEQTRKGTKELEKTNEEKVKKKKDRGKEKETEETKNDSAGKEQTTSVLKEQQESASDEKKNKDEAKKGRTHESSAETEVKTTKNAEKKEESRELDDKDKAKPKALGISSSRLPNDDWIDPWQRTTSPKRQSASSRSSRSRSSSSSSDSSRSSRSRSHSGSESHSTSRSASRSRSRSVSAASSRSRSRSGSRSKSRSRSGSHSSGSDRSSSSSSHSPVKEAKTTPNADDDKGAKQASNESSDSESESNKSKSRSPTPVSKSPVKPKASPDKGPRTPPIESTTGRYVKEKRNRYEYGRADRIEKWREGQVRYNNPWDPRRMGNTRPPEDPYRERERGYHSRRGRSPARRRRSRSPRRRNEDRRRPDESKIRERSSSADSMEHALARPSSPRATRERGGMRRVSSASSSDSESSDSGSESEDEQNPPKTRRTAPEQLKQARNVPLTSGNIRYTGHKDIKLTLNKSVTRKENSEPSKQPAPHSPPARSEASSSSDKPSTFKKRPRDSPPVSDAPATRKEAVSSSVQSANKPDKQSVDPQVESASSGRGNAANTTSRREELLRELKAVEDAIARKRARIE